MLIIARKKNESIHIGEDVEIVISELSRSVVKIAISAPRGTRVLRGEIYRAVAEANRAASDGVMEGATPENLASFVNPKANSGVPGEAIERAPSAPNEMLKGTLRATVNE